MKWQDVRERYPDTWILFEAMDAYSTDGQRVVNNLSIIDTFTDGQEALQKYALIHKKEPIRELYVYHTKNHNLDIKERMWMGVRKK
jgi:hypothetical protein